MSTENLKRSGNNRDWSVYLDAPLEEILAIDVVDKGELEKKLLLVCDATIGLLERGSNTERLAAAITIWDYLEKGAGRNLQEQYPLLAGKIYAHADLLGEVSRRTTPLGLDGWLRDYPETGEVIKLFGEQPIEKTQLWEKLFEINPERDRSYWVFFLGSARHQDVIRRFVQDKGDGEKFYYEISPYRRSDLLSRVFCLDKKSSPEGQS